MKKLTLIGGAPLAGKTTLSKEIARQDGAVEFSTDSIRSWMQSVTNPDDYPDLFCSRGMSAAQFYEKYTAAELVMQEEIDQGLVVEKAILGLLKTAITWNHLVLEGIAISPLFARQVIDQFEDREVEAFIIVDDDEDRIRERLYARGLWGPRDTYPDELLPKEVEWVILYNQWFKSEAEKYNIEIRHN